MRSQLLLLAVLLCAVSTGCGGLFRIGTRNLLYEVNLIKESRIEHVQYCRLAREAWKCVEQGNPERAYSADYASGFQSGFVDYLYAGGNGEPPALHDR